MEKKSLAVIGLLMLGIIIFVISICVDMNNEIKKDGGFKQEKRRFSQDLPKADLKKKAGKTKNQPTKINTEIKLSDVITDNQKAKLAKLGFSTTEFHAINLKK